MFKHRSLFPSLFLVVMVNLSPQAWACEQAAVSLSGFQRQISQGSAKTTATISASFPVKFDGWPIRDLALRMGSGEKFVMYAPLSYKIEGGSGKAVFEVARSALADTELVFVYHPGTDKDGSFVLCTKTIYLELENGHATQSGA